MKNQVKMRIVKLMIKETKIVEGLPFWPFCYRPNVMFGLIIFWPNIRILKTV